MPGAHYSATKSGMTGLAGAGRRGRTRITVNCVAPGRIQSAMTAEAGGAVNASHSATVPLGRLACRRSRRHGSLPGVRWRGYTTGATIDVNGGFML